jgi:hypothetical protein
MASGHYGPDVAIAVPYPVVTVSPISVARVSAIGVAVSVTRIAGIWCSCGGAGIVARIAVTRIAAIAATRIAAIAATIIAAAVARIRRVCRGSCRGA